MVIRISIIFFLFIFYTPKIVASEFLKTGVGARAFGLGGSFIALSDSPAAVYWNPAGVLQLKGLQFEGMYTEQFGLGISNSFFSIITPPFGIGILINGVNNIPISVIGTDGNPAVSETTSLNQTAVFVSYSHNISKIISLNSKASELLAGMTFKYISTKLYTLDTTGYGLDIGLLFKKNIGSKLDLKLGLNGVNVIPPALADEVLKSYFNLGAAVIYKLKENSELVLAYSLLDKSVFGVEWKNGMFILRAGQGVDDLNIGGSIILGGANTFQLDYAYSMHELGDSHRVSFSIMLP